MARYECPKCRSTEVEVEAVCRMSLGVENAEGDEPLEFDYDDNSLAWCGDCNHQSKLADFAPKPRTQEERIAELELENQNLKILNKALQEKLVKRRDTHVHRR